MGSLKEQMLGASDLLIEFICPAFNCRETVEGYVENAFYDFAAEPISDGIGVARSYITCHKCFAQHMVEVVATPGGKEVNIAGAQGTPVQFHDDTFDDDYGEFLAEYEPDDPFGVYTRAVKENDNLFHGSEIHASVRPAFNKMLFLNHVVAIETYLSDRLIDLVLKDPRKLVALVGSAEALRNNKPNMVDIAKNPSYVVDFVKSYLQRFNFHDFAAAAPFFKAVLKVELFESEEHQDEMLAITQTRHHLAHRNGRDNDGNEVVINDADIDRVRGVFERLSQRIEEAYSEYARERFAEAIETLSGKP